MRPLVFKSHYTNPYGYLTKWSRHVHNVLINGFMARELDADDHEFLEYVKVRGIANGSLPNTSLASVEELDFWHLPYDVQPGVERRAGPVRMRERPVETAEQTRARLARTNAWHARRVIREQERAIAAAEMEREREEWVKANENRKRQEIMTEAEWQAADPFRGRRAPRPKWGATIDRHYVPQWKIDEEIDAAVAKFETKKAAAKETKRDKQQRRADQLARIAAHRQVDDEFSRAVIAKAKQEIEAAKAAAHAAEQERYYEARRREAEERARRRDAAATYQQDMEETIRAKRAAQDAQARAIIAKRDAALEAERLRREAVIAEARRVIDMAPPQETTPKFAYTIPTLKDAIMTLGRSVPGKVWMEEEMERALNCERWMLDYCLNQLVREAKLRITT